MKVLFFKFYRFQKKVQEIYRYYLEFQRTSVETVQNISWNSIRSFGARLNILKEGTPF